MLTKYTDRTLRASLTLILISTSLAVAAFSTRCALGQEIKPAFEAVSIKPATGGSNLPGLYTFVGGPGTNSPGQLTCRNITLRPILVRAYNLTPYELVGPAAIDAHQFDIVAKIPPDTTKDRFEIMLQNMLAERFALAVHRESRELPIYELTVTGAKTKLRVPESAPAGTPPQTAPEQGSDRRTPPFNMVHDKDGLPVFPPGIRAIGVVPAKGGVRISARMSTVGDLLRMLQAQIGRPVADKTGMTSTYDFELFYLPEGASPFTPDTKPGPPGQAGVADAGLSVVPTLLDAFETQLGLKFVPKRGLVQVLVVDQVSTTPTPN